MFMPGTLAPTLLPGNLQVLKREPGNAHDALGITIFNDSGHHLGFIPRAKNEALARLLDAVKLLFGRLESKEKQGAWLKAQMRVFMQNF